jgi:hypothetical protein
MHVDDATLTTPSVALARHPAVRHAILRHFESAGLKVLDALDNGRRLSRAVSSELRRLIVEEIQTNGVDVLSVSWDTGFPGGAGAAWITEWFGLYLVVTSDRAPGGPYESLDQALACRFFETPSPCPELHSNSLPTETLVRIASCIVDWENGGSVWINGVEYLAADGELRESPARTSGGS